MQMTCTHCGTTHDYKAVIEYPVLCNTCGKGFTPRGSGSYEKAVASYEMWRHSTPKDPTNHDLVLPSRADTRRRCPSGYLWYEVEGESGCTTRGCPAPGHGPAGPTPQTIRALTEPGIIRTPRARTIRPPIPGATRERIQYLQLDEMEIGAIERIHAMVETNLDYPDRNRDILLIGIAERLERIENMLASLTLKDEE